MTDMTLVRAITCRDCGRPGLVVTALEGGGIRVEGCPHHVLAGLEVACCCEAGAGTFSASFLMDGRGADFLAPGGLGLAWAMARHAPPDDDDE